MSGPKQLRAFILLAAVVCFFAAAGSFVAGMLAVSLYRDSEVQILTETAGMIGGLAGLTAGVVWGLVMCRWTVRLDSSASIDALVRLRDRGLVLAMIVGTLASSALHLSLMFISDIWDPMFLLAGLAFALPASIALGEIGSSAWARRIRSLQAQASSELAVSPPPPGDSIS